MELQVLSAAVRIARYYLEAKIKSNALAVLLLQIGAVPRLQVLPSVQLETEQLLFFVAVAVCLTSTVTSITSNISAVLLVQILAVPRLSRQCRLFVKHNRTKRRQQLLGIIHFLKPGSLFTVSHISSSIVITLINRLRVS